MFMALPLSMRPSGNTYHRRFLSVKQRLVESTIPVTESGCWLWVGSLHSNGYGQFTIRKKHLKAHRISWIEHMGQIPDGLCVCHKCDVPSCVNPHHLFLGTQLENVSDMRRKGRASRKPGKGRPAGYMPLAGDKRLKLTASDVIAIRLSSEPSRVIAARFNVSHRYIRQLRQRLTWRHVS